MAVLETEHLLLRRMTPADQDALHEVLSDPVTMRRHPEPLDREMTAGWIRWSLRNYEHHGFGLWAVVLKPGSRLIGDCGLTVQRVEGVDELEIGWHVLRPHWGRGVATEAAAACRALAFDGSRRTRMISWMTAGNAASRRVAEKLGMRLEQQVADVTGEPRVVYAMGAADRSGGGESRAVLS